jgi:hypothetical protein
MSIKASFMKNGVSRSFIYIISICAFQLAGCQKDDLYLDTLKPELLLNANDPRFSASEIKFSKDTVYVLGTNLLRSSGQKLSIEAGTLIKVKNKLSITIQQGATIEAVGAPDAPIIFTSYASKGTAGIIGSDGTGTNYWYGIRVYGDNVAQPALSSGKLSYIRIEFAGGNEGFANIPCLQFNNVSNATTVNHIQVSYSFATPSIGFSGGTCNASHLVSYASNGNDFSFTEGYTGYMQFLLVYRHPYFPVLGPGANLTGFYIDGSFTSPVMSNISVIGPGEQKGNSLTYSERDPSTAVLIEGGATFQIRNSAFQGFPKAAIYLFERKSAEALRFGASALTYSFMQSTDTSKTFTIPNNVYPPFTSADFKSFMLETQFSNQLLNKTEEFKLVDPYDYNISPDPMPGPGSPLLTGADFSGIFSDPFFSKVSYRGALGDDNWLLGWINFTPLQTTYNY